LDNIDGDDENSDFVVNAPGTESIVAEMVERREEKGTAHFPWPANPSCERQERKAS
jgi:hypothetical protein